jgi:nucleotide-binding universal stress UspA family protein
VADVVVGMGGTGTSGPVVRWAAAEAALRGAALHLVHAWHAALDVSVELAPGSLPELPGGATSTATRGRPATVLLGQRPDLLVLGGHTGAPHVSHVTRACLRDALCPVVVVPDTERAPVGRVVVAVCGTDASRTALCWAEREARLRAADLVVAYMWQAPVMSRDVLHPALVLPARRLEAVDRLRGWVQDSLGRDDVELHASQGAPLDGLIEAGGEADLLVVGRSRFHAGLGSVLHGAVSNDISGLVPCPVAVVPLAVGT